jgi:hypothetical protein
LRPILNEIPLVDGQAHVKPKEKLLLSKEDWNLADNSFVEASSSHERIYSLMEGLLELYVSVSVGLSWVLNWRVIAGRGLEGGRNGRRLTAVGGVFYLGEVWVVGVHCWS